MKVQQVALNGKRICTKRRTVTHIRHRFKQLGAHARPGDVNPILRYELFIARQIDGRNRVLRSIAATPAWRPQNAERTRQQGTRPAHPSLAKQFSDMTAGNRLPTAPLLRDEPFLLS